MKRTLKLGELTSEALRKALFYAESEAGLYDTSIRKVVPEYRLAHRTLVELAIAHLTFEGQIDPEHVSCAVLDIGAGTGQEAIPLLEHFPRLQLVAVDLSEPILKILRRKVTRRSRISSRCSIVHADFLSDNLLALLPQEHRRCGYKLVVSAFAIHHFLHAEKREAFSRIFDLLADGGLFLNLDLFTFESPSLARQALAYDIDWITSNFALDGNEIANQKDTARLGRSWIAHYLEENITEPFDAEAVEGQQRMLRSAGFSEVAMPFRLMQVGITWAKK